ncbi:MAG TPA: glutamine-hydrolyzing carbamoyl-phosphate synthase small subunit [Verrucomicrobiae bacterium]|nr:glutamine-hydrolyzing carbamoyl-phosphate synthase small subunit [Verrucomicrobiae bacterium]
MKEAILALEDGFVLRGKPFGAKVRGTGEVCFNTSMTGYQEILTDPSYRGQIVAMTYPQIGNYGINDLDVESDRPQVAGFVVRELSPVASNWRSRLTLDEYLRHNGIPGIEGIDTRALTRRLRVHGALRGVLTAENLSDAAAVDLARKVQYVGVDLVKDVSTKQAYDWDPDDRLSAEWTLDRSAGYRRPLPPAKYRIVAYDFGIKHNILRRLRQEGFRVRVLPAATPAAEALAHDPDGIFLSNGPGDPEVLTYAHQAVRDLLGKKPLFGICLGHQILSFALGGRTFKLKFGHRGGNQPVKDLTTGAVAITSQNHGFATDPESLKGANVEFTHVNLNDGTCEGLRLRDGSAFAVQYHPEASPGPHDANYFFRQFAESIERGL